MLDVAMLLLSASMGIMAALFLTIGANNAISNDSQKLWSQYHNLLPALSVFVILVMLSQEKNCEHLTFVAISRH